MSTLAGTPIVTFAVNDATPKFPKGTVYHDAVSGKTYKYVQVEDAALTIGQVVELSDTTGSEVTNDRAGGASLGRIAVGVALGSVTDAYFTWIQVGGVNDYVVTDGNVTAGGALIPHATGDGQATLAESGSTAVNTEAQVFGYALTTDTTTTTKNCKAILRCAY